MSIKTDQVKKLFAQELRRCCTEAYTKIPSHERLASDLWLSSKYSLRVSRETVRKWLKGDTFPDLDCLLHLIDWLGLDMSNIFLDSGVALKAREKQFQVDQPNAPEVAEINQEQIDTVIQFLAQLKKSESVKIKNPAGMVQ